MKRASPAAAVVGAVIAATGLVAAATGEGQGRSQVVDGCFSGFGPHRVFHVSTARCASGEHAWTIAPVAPLTSASCPAAPVCLPFLVPRAARP